VTPSLPEGAGFDPNEGPGPALVAFDFDGTLAEQRGGWGLLYRLFGVEDAGEKRTQAFWNGDISYETWADGNVADWRERGVRQRHLEAAADAVKLTTGASDLVGTLDERDIPFGVLSAGVRDLIRPVERFDPAFVVANELTYDDDIPVGVVPRVPPDAKGDLLARLCAEADVDPSEVIYIGDSRSDEEALAVAGTAVLFDPDDRIDDTVSETVDHVVDCRDLSAVEPFVLPGSR
jgi:phosphoserine phosphatase